MSQGHASSLRMKSGRSEDGNLLAIEGCFKSVFETARPERFGTGPHQVVGLRDRPEGVQWVARYDQRRGACELAVNLDGTEQRVLDWPIGRLIARELLHLSIFLVGRSYPSFTAVRALWTRDRWMDARRPIDSTVILEAAVYGLARERWIEALRAASACLGAGGRGRATQRLRLAGKATDVEVSPHLQFIVPLWMAMPAGHTARLERFARARDLLLPLHGAMAQAAT